MHPLPTRHQFLKLRAQGLSFSKIAAALNFSKPTLLLSAKFLPANSAVSLSNSTNEFGNFMRTINGQPEVKNRLNHPNLIKPIQTRKFYYR